MADVGWIRKVEMVFVIVAGLYMLGAGPATSLNPDIARFFEAGFPLMTPRAWIGAVLIYFGIKGFKEQW